MSGALGRRLRHRRYLSHRYTVEINSETTTTPSPYRKNCMKVIGWPSRAASRDNDIGRGTDDGQVAAKAGPEGERPPHRIRLETGIRSC